MWKFFILGLLILIGAIIINVTAHALHVSTWYDFLQEGKATWYEYTFLFGIYPLLLGVIAYYSYQLLF